MNRMHFLFVPMTLVAAALAACGRDDVRPAEQVQDALSEARDSIARARSSIDAMEDRRQSLEASIARQRAALDALIERRVLLMREEIAALEREVQDLPAQKEAVLAAGVADLKQRLTEVEAKLGAYRDAPPEQTAASRAELESALNSFASARDDVYERLRAG